MGKKKVNTKGKTVVTGDAEAGEVKKVKTQKPKKDEAPKPLKDCEHDDVDYTHFEEEEDSIEPLDHDCEDDDDYGDDSDEGYF